MISPQTRRELDNRVTKRHDKQMERLTGGEKPSNKSARAGLFKELARLLSMIRGCRIFAKKATPRSCVVFNLPEVIQDIVGSLAWGLADMLEAQIAAAPDPNNKTKENLGVTVDKFVKSGPEHVEILCLLSELNLVNLAKGITNESNGPNNTYPLCPRKVASVYLCSLCQGKAGELSIKQLCKTLRDFALAATRQIKAGNEPTHCLLCMLPNETVEAECVKHVRKCVEKLLNPNSITKGIEDVLPQSEDGAHQYENRKSAYEYSSRQIISINGVLEGFKVTREPIPYNSKSQNVGTWSHPTTEEALGAAELRQKIVDFNSYWQNLTNTFDELYLSDDEDEWEEDDVAQELVWLREYEPAPAEE